MNSEVVKNFKLTINKSNQIGISSEYTFTCRCCFDYHINIKKKKASELSMNDVDSVLSLHLMECDYYNKTITGQTTK